MWNQWSAGPPPIPPPSTTCNPQPPLIGPVQPTEVVAAANVAQPPVVAGASTVQPVYTAPSGAPSYTPAQYAAMTPEQQYAVQQHWQQWQAYEQQYAQWHAQYGEQYKREMAAIHSGPPPTVAQYGSISASNAYAYPPPAVSNPYQPPPAPVNAPPPPPPDDKTNSTGIKALPQIYEQPPPPPPPPQQDETTPNKSGVEAQIQTCQPEQMPSSQFSQNEENNWSQPPPPSSQNQGNRWNGPPTMFNQQERQQSNQFGQQNRQQQNQFGQQNRNQQNQFGQQDTQQNQFGQQDRQQQNQFGQQDRQQQNQFGQQNRQQQNRQQQNQFGQQDRQQQNQFGQQDRQQQNQFGQQDRQQQNQFGQQERKHQNQFNQQYNNQRGRQNQGRERQGIRQNNEDHSRNNNRFSNNIDNNTQQHFDGYDDRNNRQQQQWQPSDGPRQRNNENFSNNRFDNNYNNFNNMGQQNNQQGTGWNSSQKDNSFGVSEQQKQQQPQNFKSQNTSQNNAKPMNSSGDEKAFDEQFRLWEEQFENWKKENANHPDRAMYMKYEREFEKTRVRLLERREQMRRRKMLEMGQGSNQEPTLKDLDESKQLQSQPQPQPQAQPQPQPQHLPQEQPSPAPFLQSQHQQSQQTNNEPSLPNLEQEKSVVEKTNPNPNISQEKVCEASDMEQSDPEDDGPETSEKNIEPSKITLKENPTEIINSTETNIFQKHEITELFKPTGGIPGLDLVGSKEIGSIETVEDERNNPEVIDLDKDGPTRPPKVCASSKNNMLLFSSKAPEQTPVKILEDQGLKSQATLSSQPPKRKIPSLFDIVIEKPVLSPVNESKIASPVRNSSPVVDSRSRSISKDREVLISPGQRPLSQVSATSNRQQQVQNTLDTSTEQSFVSTSINRQQSDLPPQAADLAKALQDPNVMQLLSHAIAQAQQAGVGNSSGNPQQNQLIQQLQKLRPLLQMTQNQNSNNQQWNNSQFPSQQSQNWQNQNSNNRFNMNDSNRNSFGRSSFNTNEEPLSRGFASGNDSDNSDRQQKNPRNPFRRNENRGNDNNFNNSSSEMNPDGPNAEGSFSNKNNNPFGRQLYSQPQHGNNFGRGNFDGSNLGGGNFNNRNMNVGDSYRGADFEENIANDFRGGNFGRENFQSNSFSEDNTDLGKGDFDRDNYYDGNSGGGGLFDTNRSNTNFGNSSGFRNNTNDTNNFRGGDTNDFYRPAQVFDYQNRSRSDAFIPQAKVVDYGHKPSLNMPVSSFSRDSSEFVPVKTIDYGHSSNSANKETTEAKTTKKVNRWNQEPQTNENEAHSTNIKQTQADKNQDSTKSIEGEGLSEELAKTTEEELQYPNNKWVLQNPESRQRPGPPTKRGKRKPKTKPKHAPEEDKTECDEIEENFEEISENEDMNESRQILSPSAKLKGKPLFPSVSDTNKNQPIVFPSMENNNTIPIDEILFQPGRLSRPKNIVIIIRGPPGSGKSHVAKLIKDKEVEMGGQTPRLLSIDDYFMVENDYEEKCPKTGRKIPKKEILYEYEKEAEPTYMQYLIKSFKKTVTDHLFDFIIVDCCNQSLRTFNEFYNAARDGNFSPFVIDLKCDLETCLNQNIHSRKEEEIKEIIKNYQDCPGHYIKLDVSNLLENVVEMEDVSDLEDNFVADSEVIDLDDDDEEDEEQNDNVAGGFLKSKWDTDPTTENLARLDGTSKPISKRGTATIEEYLQIDGWEPPASNTDGKKRVRWADIEEKRAQDKMRAIGFVVGQTDWNRMMDPTSGSGALTKTKYIERYNKRR